MMLFASKDKKLELIRPEPDTIIGQRVGFHDGSPEINVDEVAPDVGFRIV